jgi:hypothetical protein
MSADDNFPSGHKVVQGMVSGSKNFPKVSKLLESCREPCFEYFIACISVVIEGIPKGFNTNKPHEMRSEMNGR